MRIQARAFVFVAMFAMLGATRAEPALANLTLGDLWYGDPISLDELQGRVVLVEFWGRN